MARGLAVSECNGLACDVLTFAHSTKPIYLLVDFNMFIMVACTAWLRVLRVVVAAFRMEPASSDHKKQTSNADHSQAEQFHNMAYDLIVVDFSVNVILTCCLIETL